MSSIRACMKLGILHVCSGKSSTSKVVNSECSLSPELTSSLRDWECWVVDGEKEICGGACSKRKERLHSSPQYQEEAEVPRTVIHEMEKPS